MGVQLEFVCAVTQNDVVARTIQTGNYAIADHVIETLAPAMDIQVYNPNLSGLSNRVFRVRKAREIAIVEFYLKDNMSPSMYVLFSILINRLGKYYYPK